jgi:CubicO group peptidase (beta-lactamase class C family)
MSDKNPAHLDRFLADGVMRKNFPGAVCWIGNGHETYFYEKYGHRQILPARMPMTRDTLFDLASITKPLVTAMMIMKLIDEKKLKLDDKIARFIPAFKHKINAHKTIKQLLTHTSGIPSWFPVYFIPPELRLKFFATQNTGKRAVLYSCLGYLILGEIVENISGLRLNQLYQHLTDQLKLKYTSFNPPPKTADVAATENGDLYEREKAFNFTAGSPVRSPDRIKVPDGFRWRDYVIKKEVHDGNCHYGYRGVAGNAGLFSNAADLVKIMRAYLNAEIVRLPTLRLMTRSHTGCKNPRGLGWLLNIYPGILSPRAFGHTGFTGTMVCHDPAIDLTVILLTNDIHPRVKPDNMPPLRKRLMKIIARIVKP